jgi:hypothetical protein
MELKENHLGCVHNAHHSNVERYNYGIAKTWWQTIW